MPEPGVPLRHKLEAGRPGSPDYAALEVPLHLGFGQRADLWLWTPEDPRGFRLRLYVEEGDQASRAHLNVGLEPAGLPVAEAYANARFLYALHAGSGRLVFTMLEPRRDSVVVAELPLIKDDPEALAQLEAQLRFLDDLVAVDEATGAGLVYPREPARAEDVRGARRAAEAVRKGWISEPVENVRLVPTAEGARALPLDEGGPEAVLTLTIEDAGPWERLLGRELDLGPRVHWIERARLAPGEAERLRGWLAEGPEPAEGIEVVLAPDGDSPMHVFFAEWPKPSLERVRREIEAFEERYGMRSDEFGAAWKAGREVAWRVEDGEAWMSLLRAREALERGRLP